MRGITFRAVVGLALVAVLSSGACAQKQPAPESALGTGEPAQQQPPDLVAQARELMDEEAISGKAVFKGVLDVRGEKKAEITMGDDRTKHETYFEPSILIGSPGQEITVRVTNWGFVPHTFTVMELGVDAWIQSADAPGEPGETKTFKVTFPEAPGLYLIHCRPHDTGGMTGALVAED
ncbi:MAG TPA: plastocyanin/azurin family copper-binding protein [Actinomycetota bacterium]|jgi:plastocyanin|nr:plastocyanin/azurin family copper-binding protein [Actinomycetota bacterium]